MAITYPISLPSAPGFTGSRLRMRSVVAVSASPFTGEQQVYQHQGQWWEGEATLPPMLRAGAEPWLAAFASLFGRRGTFLFGDPDGKVWIGASPGVPLVNGASQTGNSLITDAWTAGMTIKAGNYIQIGSGSAQRLYKIPKDVVADGSGNATLDIFPRLRESPANDAAITTANCKGQFRLISDFEWTADQLGRYAVTFSMIEAI